MKTIKLIFAFLFFLIGVQFSYGQIYTYSGGDIDKSNADKNCLVAKEYVTNKFSVLKENASPQSYKIYAVPNNKKLVVVEFLVAYTEYKELQAVDGHGFLTDRGWTDHVTKAEDKRFYLVYGVLLSPNGSPLAAFRASERFVLSFDESYFVILLSQATGKAPYRIYPIAQSFDYNGNKLWFESNDNIMIYDYDFMNQIIYLVGEKNRCSYYRLINASTGKVVEEGSISAGYSFRKISHSGNTLQFEECNLNETRSISVDIYSIGYGQTIGDAIKASKQAAQKEIEAKEDREMYNQMSARQWKEIKSGEEYRKWAYDEYSNLLKFNKLSSSEKAKLLGEYVGMVNSSQNGSNMNYNSLLNLAKRYKLSSEVQKIEASKKESNNATEKLIEKMKSL